MISAKIMATAIVSVVVGVNAVSKGIPGTSLPDPVVDADYYPSAGRHREKIELGRVLFFDKILSGNRNISCATCHHPKLASGDGLALPLGEGPTGLGPERQVGDDPIQAVHGRVPRNSPALFNLGALEFERMFHDGRVETDKNGYYEGGFITPAKWKLPNGLENVLAAQAMFPVVSHVEMAGERGENPVADAVALNRKAGKGGAWDILSSRIKEIPEYVQMFEDAFPGQVTSEEDISFVLVANAIAAFEADAFRSDNSAFDRALRGEPDSLSESAERGMGLFYGDAGCASCHSGKFQTDHEFHAIAMPQIGPGKADGADAQYWETTGHQVVVEDHGRGRVTMRREDDYKFRTPSLRNVALTGPWGHAGSYDTLESVVRHHLNPVDALHRYRVEVGKLPEIGTVLETTMQGSKLEHRPLVASRQTGFDLRDSWVQSQPELRQQIANANELAPRSLTDRQIGDLVSFLESLTDPMALRMEVIVPQRVPSELPVED